MTALHLAARRGFTEISSLLLNDSRVKGTSLNQGTFSPFHMACLGGNRETCELLLKNGADIMYRTANHSTSLHFAAYKGYEETCQLLIETGDHLYCFICRLNSYVMVSLSCW